jgi:SAM-dependent methyltransferase
MRAEMRRRLQRTRAIARRECQRFGRWWLRAALDLRDRLTGKADPLVPPRRLGLPSQLPGVGANVLEHVLVDAADLRPTERVLDIGCGPGRVAVYLTRFLAPGVGSYEGLDVMPRAIAWGQRRIAACHPNFGFTLAALRHEEYSPDGGADAGSYRFPYPDCEFDLAFAISLYTHLLPYEVANYLAETARVLKSGGRSAATFFLLDAESERRSADGITRPWLAGSTPLRISSALDDGRGGRYRAADPDRPRARTFLYEADVLELHERAGLRVADVRYGHWRGGDPSDRIGQDVVIAVS